MGAQSHGKTLQCWHTVLCPPGTGRALTTGSCFPPPSQGRSAPSLLRHGQPLGNKISSQQHESARGGRRKPHPSCQCPRRTKVQIQPAPFLFSDPHPAAATALPKSPGRQGDCEEPFAPHRQLPCRTMSLPGDADTTNPSQRSPCHSPGDASTGQ